mgnify:CR=1 FL=1
MRISHWFIARQELSPAKNKGLVVASFLLPLLIWAIVSYVPFVWHPMMKISDFAAGGLINIFPVVLPKKQSLAVSNPAVV